MKAIKLILFNLFILFVLLVVIDPFLGQEKSTSKKICRSLILRESGPNRTFETDPYGHDVDTAKLDSKSYLTQTDDYGFVCGPNDDFGALPQVLFFGGSTTACAFVDDSLRFPYLVGKQIEKVSRNAGFGGNHSFHSLINLLGKGLPVRPEKVVWMHNINDLSLLSKTGSYYVSPKNRDVLNVSKQGEETTFSQRIKNLGRAFVRATVPNIYLKIYILNQPKSVHVDEWQGYRERFEVDDDVVKKIFEGSLKSFVGIAKSNGIEVVLMTQFNRINLADEEVMGYMRGRVGNYTSKEFVAIYKELNEIIRRVALEENIQLIDLANRVPSSPEYLYDAVHLNNAGSKLVAQIVSDAFKTKDSELGNQEMIIKEIH